MIKVATRTNARAAEAYFLREPQLTPAEKTGRWLGSLADAFELPPRPITSDDFDRALAGRIPSGPSEGTPLFHRPFTKRRIVAYDLIVTPHKSLSLAALFGPPALRQAVRRVFEAAVRRIPALIEKLSPSASRPVRQLLLAAMFVHEFSRRGTPHLHAHLIVPAFSVDADPPHRHQRLSPRPIFTNLRKLTRVFQRILHAGLLAEGFSPTPSVVRSVASVTLPALPPAVVADLSNGSRDIDRRLEATPPPPRLSSLAWRDALNYRHRPKKGAVAPLPPAPLRVFVPWRQATLPAIYPTRRLAVYRHLKI